MLKPNRLVPIPLLAVGCTAGWLFASSPLAVLSAQDTKPGLAAGGEAQLPKPDPAFKGKIGETYQDSKPDHPQPTKAAKGSPNVLLILLDDVGSTWASA